ncbi:Hypothetical protein POVR2_LOCUS175 [uncultured virus]|nr:Hypothetical protein POVR2_LOCUS175 [uncultured virus]
MSIIQHLPVTIDELVRMLDSSQNNSSDNLRYIDDPIRLSDKQEVVKVGEHRNLLVLSLVTQNEQGVTRHRHLIFDFSTALVNARRDILDSIWLASKQVKKNPPGLHTELVQVDVERLLHSSVKQVDPTLLRYLIRWKELDRFTIAYALDQCCYNATASADCLEVLDLLLSTKMAYPSLSHLAHCNIPVVALKLLRSQYYGYRHSADKYILEVEELIATQPYTKVSGRVKHKFVTADDAGYFYRDHYPDCRAINRDGNWTSCVTDDIRFRVVVYEDQVLEVYNGASVTARKKIEEMNKIQPRDCS